MLKYIFKDTNIKITLFHGDIKEDLSKAEIQKILQEFYIKG